MTDASTTPDAVLTEQHGRVLLITLNRPDAMNAINGALANGLWNAVQRLNDDPGLTAGVLTGAGRGFSAGMDLKAFARGEDIGPMMTFIKNGSNKPLIGAIEGFALAGGLELALSCDLLAAGGGLLRLPTRVGYGKAMEMAITGDPITAEEGHAFGLIARLTEKGEAVATAMSLAERIARNAPLAVAASKQLVKATQGTTEAEFWKLQDTHMGVFVSNDAKEGPKAFAEKRAPEWTGS
jgi:enoyl-CoA hydratase